MKEFRGVRSLFPCVLTLVCAATMASQVCFAADEKPPGATATETTASPKPVTGATSTVTPPKTAATANNKAKPLESPNVEDAWERRIQMFDVDSVPLFEVVAQMRKQFPELNFLIRNGAPSTGGEPIDMAAVSIKVLLRNVTLSEILKALELAAERPIAIKADPSDRLIVFEPAKEGAQMERPPVVTRAYNLSEYLAGLNEEQMRKAMQEINEVIEITGHYRREATGGKRGDMKIHFHPGTRLLIAIGRPDELEVVEQIAGELQGRRGGTPTGGFPAPAKAATPARGR